MRGPVSSILSRTQKNMASGLGGVFEKFNAIPASSPISERLVIFDSAADPIVSCTEASMEFRVVARETIDDIMNALRSPTEPNNLVNLIIPKGSIITIRGPSNKFNRGCIYAGQDPEEDGFFTVSRTLTETFQYSKITGGFSSLFEFTGRIPSLDDIYDEGSIKFTRDNLQNYPRLAMLTNTNRNVGFGEADINSAEESGTGTNPSGVDGEEDYWAWERRRDAAEDAALKEAGGEAELNGADVNIAAQTRMIGWNLNRNGNGPASRSAGFEPPFNGPDIKVNCTDCYFGISFGITVEMDWSIRTPSKNRMEVTVFADTLYNYNLGISNNVPKPKLSWSKKLYTIPVMRDRQVAMIGPIPIILSADIELSLSTSFDIPIKMDNVFYGGGASRTIATIIKNKDNRDAQVSQPTTRVTQEKPRGTLRPMPAQASLGLRAKFVVRLQKMMSIDFSTGPSFAIKTSNNLLTESDACKPSPRLITQFSNQPNNPVVASSKLTGGIDWTSNINLNPVDISVFSFKWTPWSIRLHAFPTIELVRLFELCFPLRRDAWRLISIRLDWGRDRTAAPVRALAPVNARREAELNGAELDSMENPTQRFQKRKRVTVYVDVTV